MLSREKYSQQDVDYAFSLAKKERQGGVDSSMFEGKEEKSGNLMLDDEELNDRWITNMKNPNASASGTYQMLIMKSVFGGMKDRCSKKFKGAYSLPDMLIWITNDAEKCIANHRKEMETIIRGLRNTTENPDEYNLKAGFNDLMAKWIFQLFHNEKDINQYKIIIQTVTDPLGAVMDEVEKIITSVLEEK